MTRITKEKIKCFLAVDKVCASNESVSGAEKLSPKHPKGCPVARLRQSNNEPAKSELCLIVFLFCKLNMLKKQSFSIQSVAYFQ